MLGVAARIPEAAVRDQFADRLAHRARITEEVVRAEIRKAAVNRQATAEVIARQVLSLGQVKQAERGLIWALIREPKAGLDALSELEPPDLDGLATAPIIEQARSLQGWPADSLPEALIERLNEGEAGLVQEISRQPHPPALRPGDCVSELRRLRYVRERTEVQREIDKLQEEGASRHADRIVALLNRKLGLAERIDALGAAVADSTR